MSNVYGAKIEIWAGFGPEKKVLANYEELLRAVFSCYNGQKNAVF